MQTLNLTLQDVNVIINEVRAQIESAYGVKVAFMDDFDEILTMDEVNTAEIKLDNAFGNDFVARVDCDYRKGAKQIEN